MGGGSVAETEARKRILSIDGGGIRGIIPLCVLVKLEAKLKAERGESLRDVFNFVAGTSTGSIIAAGIAAGKPASDMLDLYVNRVGEVFPSGPWLLPKRAILGHMYSSKQLRAVIERELGPAGGWKLNDSTKVDLLIAAKRLTDGMPWYFTKDKRANLGQTGKLSLVDCVTASAAAPTYFDPFEIRDEITLPSGKRERVGLMIDGGVGTAGNPVYQACVEAFKYSEGYVPQETTVVSLGTGHYLGRRRPTWIGAWLDWLIAELLRSPGEQQTELVHRHYPGATFYRIDTILKRDIQMDEGAATGELREYGERLAEKVDWDAILAGQPLSPFSIGSHNTLPRQYAVPLPSAGP